MDEEYSIYVWMILGYQTCAGNGITLRISHL